MERGILKSVLIINTPTAKTKTGIGSVNVPSNVSALKTVPLELKLYFIGILSPIYQNQTGQAFDSVVKSLHLRHRKEPPRSIAILNRRTNTMTEDYWLLPAK